MRTDMQNAVREHYRSIPPWRRALGLLVTQRVRPLWVTVSVLLGLFAIFRAALLHTSRDALEGLAAGNVFRCFLVGLRYDAIAIAYAMIPLALTVSLFPNISFPTRVFRCVVAGYAALIATLVVIVEIVGYFFFRQFGARLNYLTLDYTGSFREPAAYIWQNYPVWILPLALILGPVGLFLFFKWAFWRGAAPRGRIWPRPLWAGALMGLAFLAARGTVGHHRLRFGPAYFTNNKVLSQLALNNFFTFGEACKSYFNEKRELSDDYPFPDEAVAWRVTRQMLAQPADTFLDRPDNPLWRRSDSGRPRKDYNIVIIVMEGMAGRDVGILGHKEGQTPQLDALCEKGAFFERMYAVGDRTSHGLIGIFCGHPDLEGKSVMKRSRAQGNFLSLPGMLKARGYETIFILGSNSDFDNMGGFFSAGGVDRIIDRRNMPTDKPTNVWGAHDEGIFFKADQVLRKQGDKPFFAIIATGSNHEPFDVPEGRVELLATDDDPIQIKRKINAYRYADWALGEFFRNIADAPYFQNTIFVLVPDQERTSDQSQILDVIGFHVPCLIYAPGIVGPRRITAAASQTDIAPTVLSLLGGTYDHCFLGRNMLAVAEDDKGFAFIRNGRRMALVRGDRVLVQPPGSPPLLLNITKTTLVPVPADRIQSGEKETALQQMLSYYLLARNLYLANAYRVPAAQPRSR